MYCYGVENDMHTFLMGKWSKLLFLELLLQQQQQQQHPLFKRDVS